MIVGFKQAKKPRCNWITNEHLHNYSKDKELEL